MTCMYCKGLERRVVAIEAALKNKPKENPQLDALKQGILMKKAVEEAVPGIVRKIGALIVGQRAQFARYEGDTKITANVESAIETADAVDCNQIRCKGAVRGFQFVVSSPLHEDYVLDEKVEDLERELSGHKALITSQQDALDSIRSRLSALEGEDNVAVPGGHNEELGVAIYGGDTFYVERKADGSLILKKEIDAGSTFSEWHL